jgi:hypothetical protein
VHPFIRFDRGARIIDSAMAGCGRFDNTGLVSTGPGSRKPNPWIESSNDRLRDEMLTGRRLDNLLEPALSSRTRE